MKKMILALTILLSFNTFAKRTFNEEFEETFTLEREIKMNHWNQTFYDISIYRSKIDGECYSLLVGPYRGSLSLVKCSSFELVSPEYYLENYAEIEK